MTTYLVESYVPGLDRELAAALDARMGTATATRPGGHSVVWCGSLAIVAEETYASILCSDGIADVLTACHRAGISCDHVVEVYAHLDPGS